MRYFNTLDNLEKIISPEREALLEVTRKFAFRANAYYLSLIDWDDPDDPIRRIIIPHCDELQGWGRLDPSNEQAYTILPGMEHKYDSTLLLLVSNLCEGICRYCFRKRVFIHPKHELMDDLDAVIEYAATHSEITNVLLTGGDPLTLSTSKLERIISRLRTIEHIKIIRIGSRMPVFNPYRIIEDPSLPEMIQRYSLPDRKIYIMTHFTHPREMTDTALEGIALLQKAGAILTNQCPLIRGVNDNPEILADLLRHASFAGIVPYYLFQCRPALGNFAYTVPIEEGYRIFEAAKAKVSGLAKRLRYVMSHSTGKIEILAVTDENAIFKYQRAAHNADSGRVIVCKSNPAACWLDDYEELQDEYPVQNPYRLYGPD